MSEVCWDRTVKISSESGIVGAGGGGGAVERLETGYEVGDGDVL